MIYVVSGDSAVLAAAWQRLTLSVLGSAFTTASTLSGVSRLGFTANSSKWTSPRHFKCHERGVGVPGRLAAPLHPGGVEQRLASLKLDI